VCVESFTATLDRIDDGGCRVPEQISGSGYHFVRIDLVDPDLFFFGLLLLSSPVDLTPAVSSGLSALLC